MCLIDQVESWDNAGIKCHASSHRKPDHPLRLNDELSAIHLIEYGAQAMAIHGGLLKGTAIPGYLAAIRNVHFHITKLDSIASDISILATLLITTDAGAIYEFAITGDNKQLAEGRATIINTKLEKKS